MSIPAQRAAFIKKEASRIGFDFCGIAKAERLDSEEARLESWLAQGKHGTMSYMANHFEKRLDPSKLVPGAKSVVTLIYNYFPNNDDLSRNNLKIARYAYGEDYHFVIKDKLKELVFNLQSEIGEVDGRVFVDSAPVLERVWAKNSGLGWIGKNSLLLNKEMGSYFFLATVILDLDLEYDGPMKDYCGTCTKCLDACPTDAIPEPFIVDASKCISYLTIELKDSIPSEFSDKMEGWVFGCDICQEVCPWNRFSKPALEERFQPNKELLENHKNQWKELTEEVFKQVFKKSAVKRTKYSGFKRNLEFIRGKKKSQPKLG